MLPPAPPTFSMMTGWPSNGRMRSAMMRATTSVDPPGGNGTTSVMVRAGQVWPCASMMPANAASATATISLIMLVHPHRRSPPGTVGQLLLLDREHRRRLDLDVPDDTDAAANIGELSVIAAGLDAGDAQTLVVIDLAVTIVLALVRAPLVLAGRREIEFLHGIGGQVPEADAAAILRGRGGTDQQEKRSTESYAHRLSPSTSDRKSTRLN